MKKTLTVILAFVLVVVISVTGTFAYLTSSDSVTNTFTVGKVAITLDEAKVENGVAVEGADRVKANSYKLLPGQEYDKDPTVHVDAQSEDAWLFVKVENEISAIENSENTVAAQMAANGWTAVTGATGVYAYEAKVSAEDDIVVFENFTIADSVDNATLASYANKTIKVTAYAVQAAGFASAAEAWAADPLT